MKLQNIIHILIGIVCFGLLPNAQAVTPAPDGGYPGGNTAEGTNALFSCSSGIWDTALGAQALFNDIEGAMNTATGFAALFNNTLGNQNTAYGAQALYNNTTGYGNEASGFRALYSNTGRYNTGIGYAALLYSTTGDGNIACGAFALWQNTTGGYNTAVGGLGRNTTGFANVAVGNALPANTTGNLNTALGDEAGYNVRTASNVTCIGSGVFGADVSNTTWIGNIYGVATQNTTTAPVVVSADGQLGTLASSERFKKDIATMDKASEAIMSLRPVTFHYKTDSKGTPQFGLIAEEVEKVDPDLVVRDKEGKPYSVRYDQVNAMLLNEFLKEHRKVEQLEKQIEALAAGLQKVSAQLEATKPAPQVVLGNQ